MPSKRVRFTGHARREMEIIRPSVRAWLESGDLSEARRDNGWLVLSLTSEVADDARAAWQAGDEDLARAHLRRCVAAHNLFL